MHSHLSSTASRQRVLLAAILMLVGGACGRSRVQPAPRSSDEGCTAWSSSTSRIDSASVVLTWPIDAANIVRPTNPGERFVFAHAYEPLVRTDCLGRATPALAKSWALVDGGTRVRLVLRDSARFSNGDAVTTRDVIASWTATGRGAWGVLARRLTEAAAPIDERTLEISCEAANREPPGRAPATGTGSDDCALLAALGDPELVVLRTGPGTDWPIGTGTHRVRDGMSSPADSRGTRRRRLVLAPSGTRGAHLTVHSVGAADARDLVDSELDLLLTEDPALAAYASARTDVASIPLPWDRTWVLMTPGRRDAPPGELDPDTVAARTLAFRAALARDVVPADARAAEYPRWWREAAACTAPSATPQRDPGGRVNPRVAVRDDEPIARALAERLVALAANRPGAGQDSALALLAPALLAPGGRVTVLASSPNDFASALHAGSELAFVVSLPRRSLAPCVERARLRALAPWIVAPPSPLGRSATVTPLTDTRLHAVVRHDWLALTMTWDSTIVITPQ